MTVAYYKTAGGYYYKVAGGRPATRISKGEFEEKKERARSPECNKNLGTRQGDFVVGDKVRVKIKSRGVYDSEAEGIVERKLTSKKRHTRGIKVRLVGGIIGRTICVFK